MNFKWTFNSINIDNQKDCAILQRKYKNIYNGYFVRVAFIYFASIFRVYYYYLKQYSIVLDDRKNIGVLLLGAGRGYELNNVQNIFKISSERSILIHAYCMGDYMKYQRVSASLIASNLFKSISEYRLTLKSNVNHDTFEYLLKNGLQTISIFSYLRSFFSEFLKNNNKCVVYTSNTILASHAAILSGFKTINLYHGLMDPISSDAYPDYYSIYVYSDYEKKYLYDSHIKSKVYVYPYKPLISKLKAVIIFMADSLSFIDMNSLQDVMELFSGYKIYIKPHPLNNAPDQLISHYDLDRYKVNELFDSSKVSFIEDMDASTAISKKNPSFVVGWGSTSLCEALNMSVIPIDLMGCLSSPEQVYPTHSKSLVWPSDRKVISNVIANNSDYDNIISLLKSEGTAPNK